MTISLTRMDPQASDRGELVAFMMRNRFPFHVGSRPVSEQVEARIDAGRFSGQGTASYWLEDSSLGRVGMVTLTDLDERAPMLDLRLDERFRGHGLGTAVLREITRFVFETFPEVTRFEGETREDNIAMRQVFMRCGFLKEAHYRETWPVEGGAPRAGVAYGILRHDWETGTVTPVRFDDLGY